MRWLLAILFILVAAVIAGVFLHDDPGYVLIGHGKTTIEMSLSLFVVLMLTGFGVVSVTLYLARNLWGLPGSLKRWRKFQRRERARRDIMRGLIQFAEGKWEKAERFLVRHAYDSEIPLLNYLAAARAAQKQNRIEKRDEYLALAQQSTDDSSFAVDLAKSEMQLISGQIQEALQTLQPMYERAPRHQQVLLLLARTYEAMRNWQALRDLLSVLQRREVFQPQQFSLLEQKVYRELLTLATQHNDLKKLNHIWNELPKTMQQHVGMARHYARCLLTLEQHVLAEEVVRETLRRGYDGDLIYLYGIINGKEKDRQLASAEKWLDGNERDPVLLLTLGRLCFRNQLWGKCRSYLEASLGIEPRSDTYRELGLLLEKINQPKEAAENYRKGLILAQEERLDDMLTVTPQPQTLPQVT